MFLHIFYTFYIEARPPTALDKVDEVYLRLDGKGEARRAATQAHHPGLA
jgi:hypothetical protein